MADDNHIIDYDRANVGLQTYLVKDVLPEHFRSDYPNLISFLEGYYDYLNQDDAISVIKDLYAIRDIERADAAQLDLIFLEIATGASREYFADPREVLRNFANFYRVKGTRYSAEGFFRAFFNTDIQIEYPRDNIFIVGESEIGIESLKYIINYGLYQIFSVLIKSSIPINQWRELYKKFVHPAGWFLAGDIQIEETGILWGLGQNPFISRVMPDVILDSGDDAITVEGIATFTFGTSLVETIGRIQDGIDSGSGETFISFHAIVDKYADFTVAQLEAAYGTIANTMHVNSPTFDDEFDSDFYPTPIISFDNNAETMDQNWWRRTYDSLNENFMFDGYVDSDYVEQYP